jgi:hypothetical protein
MSAKVDAECAETQRSEMEALSAIFGDSFRIIEAEKSRDPLAKERTTPAPIHFAIRLVPHPGKRCGAVCRALCLCLCADASCVCMCDVPLYR